MLRLFRYLGPEDLCRCSQVCSSWSELAKTGSLWRHLFPVRWARGKRRKTAVNRGGCRDVMLINVSNVGDYYSGPPGDLDQEPDEDWVRSRQNEGRAYQEWDEDADVDESGGFFWSCCSSVDQTGKRHESDKDHFLFVLTLG